MDTNAIVKFSEKLHHIAAGSGNLIEADLSRFKRINAVDDPQKLAQVFRELQNNSRLMNIGIVGRVKAGKSSLLNALIFDGQSILPKAATPMTAALTTITWGEHFSAEIEFFSAGDIAAIREKAGEYRERLDQRVNECYQELIERQRQKASNTQNKTNEDGEKLKAMAERKAATELRNEESLFAAYDQHQRMEQSGLDVGSLEGNCQVAFSSSSELAEKLKDFVGSEGRFMPFTKAVHIFMPLESLRDICIVDTPGMNDPVQSREERTVDLLKSCDVVFIVSPAGQFLNEQDLEVMGRITRKEGVQELVLVASQVDTQLYGSEKRPTLNAALENIRNRLAHRAVEQLTILKQHSPEVGSVFDDLIRTASRNILHSSGLCHSLHRRFEKPESWDANEKKSWDNLCVHYPDFFAEDKPGIAQQSLKSLANIDAIQHTLDRVRQKKAEITGKRLASLADKKQQGLNDFRAEIISLAKSQIAQLKATSIDELDQQLNLLEEKKADLAITLDPIYRQCMDDRRDVLKNEMKSSYRKLFRDSEASVEAAESSTIEIVTVDKDGLIAWGARFLGFGGTKEVQRKRTKIITTQIYSAISAFYHEIQDELDNRASAYERSVNLELSRRLVPAIRDILENDIKGNMIKQAILGVIDSIPSIDFTLEIDLPSSLRGKGTLTDEKADKYKEEAMDFLDRLSEIVNRKITSSIATIKNKIPKTISQIFVNNIEDRIKRLKEQLNEYALTQDRLHRLVREAEEAVL